MHYSAVLHDVTIPVPMYATLSVPSHSSLITPVSLRTSFHQSFPCTPADPPDDLAVQTDVIDLTVLIALTAGRAKGYKVVLCMPESIAKEKIDHMRRLGAEVHVQPVVPLSSPLHYQAVRSSVIIHRSLFIFWQPLCSMICRYCCHCMATKISSNISIFYFCMYSWLLALLRTEAASTPTSLTTWPIIAPTSARRGPRSGARATSRWMCS